VKLRIHKGDTVEVVTGKEKDKGLRGEVVRVMPKSGRVVVQGINMRKKHQREMQTEGRRIAPGIVDFEGPLHVSNVMLVCPKCSTAARVSFTRDENGSHRVCKNCGKQID
jgi:large subunit ribosomal protein L24